MGLESDEMRELARRLLDLVAEVIVEHAPTVRNIASEIIETVFIPRAVARQLALAVALETGALTLDQFKHVLHFLSASFSSRSRLIRQLLTDQSHSTTQDEWMDLAERIDTIQNNDSWRSDPACPLYESDRISSRVDELVHLMRRRDVFDLMFTLRGGIARNKFGLLHEGLFSKALAGTKVLVETYHNVVCAALDYVADVPSLPGDDPIPTDARLAFFNETRHSYGRTALLLSGGAALGFYHVGVVKALMSNGLLPRVIGGASAGSIVCAMVATRTDEECVRDLFEIRGTNAPGHYGELKVNFFRPHGYLEAEERKAALRLRRRRQSQMEQREGGGGELGEVLHNTAGAFRDARLTLQLLFPIGLRQFTSFLYDLLAGHTRPGELLKADTSHLRECVRTCVGDFTFQEAFDRTGRILNIIVSPQNRSDPPRLLNYLTAPHVLVWSAAVASSSLPGVFEPSKLLVKDADGTVRNESAGMSPATFQDGSMEADLPMQQLSEMFNVNHFLVSQANPHAVFLASFNVNKSVWTTPLVGLVHGVLLFLKNQVRAWITNAVEFVGGRRAAPLWDTRRGVASQLFTQEYEGRDLDVSLVPWRSHRSLFSAFLHCIYNPSEKDFMEWTKASERETWKYIPKIKSHLAEEMTLDRCVQRLRKRLVMEARENARPSVQTRLVHAAGEKMNQRVPSFFTSPSLVNLGGLGVGDRYDLAQQSASSLLPSADENGEEEQQQHQQQQQGARDHSPPAQPVVPTQVPSASAPLPPSVQLKPGWLGMGLRGNHSYASLNKNHSSAGSGLFLMDGDGEDDDFVHPHSMQSQSGQTQQAAGETPKVHYMSNPTLPSNPVAGQLGPPHSNSPLGGQGQSQGGRRRSASMQNLIGPDLEGGGYIKTTSMANFYYRKTSAGNLRQFGTE
mmetsp:Transcript_25349/g.74584  ORF Transcript_25349/g.74584 Transcript_25349/m.74584 type:complete len:908 (-) Transcript_25349:59-2782(-)